ncbi:MAG: tetratricopeptide repeat protein [Deltaproteobacteria bacterium]|nr:tetratricopeptide repeat protein [Deltaproteobacteria bacterium]
MIASVVAAVLAASPATVPVTTSSTEALAEYRQALVLIDDQHLAAATAKLQHAIALDPHFATAHAQLASISNLQIADAELKLATADAAKLPEAERAQIELVAAGFHGQDAEARALRRKLVALAPGDWRAQLQLGLEAIVDRDWPRAIRELDAATKLEPKAGGALNMLGYAYMMSTRYDDAASVLRRYAALEPSEPNPHDSLAEALMNGGHLAESEAEFRKAVEVDPHFPQSWMAVGELRFMQGDWKGGEAALAKEYDADERLADKLAAELVLSEAQEAQGRVKEADATMAKALATGEAQRQPQMFARTNRAILATIDGKPDEALALTDAELKFLEKLEMDPKTKDLIRGAIVLTRLRAHALQRNAAESRADLAKLESLLASTSKQAFVASNLADGRGLAKLAAGDAKGAAASMQGCLAVDSICQWDLIQAQQAAGDRAGVEATRAKLSGLPIRNINYVYVLHALGITLASR